MPKKKASENYDALGGIFDFIFAQADKPKGQRRPVKTKPGISGESALTDALITTLENPGVFMSNTIVDEFNGALELELGTVKFDEAGKVKVTTNNVIDLLRDPGKFVDSAVKKNQAARKYSRARFLGGVMDDLLMTSWAHKFGDTEARMAALGAVSASHVSESYTASRAMGQYAKTQAGEKPSKIMNARIPGGTYAPDVNYMADRAFTLLGRKTFGPDWDGLSEDDRGEFERIVSQGDSAYDTQAKISAYLAAKYPGQTYSADFVSVTGTNPKAKINVFSPDLYKELEVDNLQKRITDLAGAPVGSAQDNDRRMYQKTLLLLQRDRHAIASQISTLKTELAAVTTTDRKKELKQQLKESKNALRDLGAHSLFGQIGKYEGYINSLNTVWGTSGSNIVPSILSGDFFDPNKNTVLNPLASDEQKFGGFSFAVAKTLTDPSGNPRGILNAYNKMGEAVYYATPRSVFRTLMYNGEGFGRLLYSRMNSLNSFSALSKLGGLGVTSAAIQKEFNEKSGKDLDTYVKSTLASAAALLSPEEYKKFQSLLNSSKTLKSIGNITSIPSRIQGIIQDRINNIASRYRARFARLLLKNKAFRNLLVRTGANKLLGQWIAGAGIKVLIKSLVTAVAGLTSLVASPVGGAIISAVTWVVTELAIKLGKYGLILLKYMSLGIVAVFALLMFVGSGSVSNFNDTNFAYSNAVPNSVVDCGAYDNDPIEGNIFTPVDYDQMCANGESIQEIYSRVASSMGLGTQLELVTCPGHYMCDSISWAWCYSASSIFCKADELASVLYDCSILERLFIHELVHQIQGGNAGGVYGTLLREWGADFLSANGGGYSFLTSDGCVRATQVDLSACDEETLTAIAYSEGWAYETECRRALSNYIKDFCAR